jgi:TRAP-type C4-dicarboxylate transport system permease small subunit
MLLTINVNNFIIIIAILISITIVICYQLLFRIVHHLVPSWPSCSTTLNPSADQGECNQG